MESLIAWIMHPLTLNSPIHIKLQIQNLICIFHLKYNTPKATLMPSNTIIEFSIDAKTISELYNTSLTEIKMEIKRFQGSPVEYEISATGLYDNGPDVERVLCPRPCGGGISI